MKIDESTLQRLRDRQANLEVWLDEQAPYARADQRHLRANTPERAYWHYGYMIALKDVLRFLSNQPSRTDTQE